MQSKSKTYFADRDSENRMTVHAERLKRLPKVHLIRMSRMVPFGTSGEA